MTKDLEAAARDAGDPQEAVANVVRSLDGIADLDERFQEAKRARETFDEAMKGVLQRIALGKREQGATWRQVGEAMGGVSAQRAEQISRGVRTTRQTPQADAG